MRLSFNWTVGRRITAGFTVIVALTAAVGGIGLLSMTHIEAETRRMDERALPAVVLVSRIQSMVKENYINTAQHYLAETTEERDRIEKAMDAMSAELTVLYGQFEPLLEGEDETTLYAQIKVSRGLYRTTRSEVLQLSRANDMAAARLRYTQELYTVYSTYIRQLDQMVGLHRTDAQVTAAGILDRAVQTRIQTVAALGSLLAVCVGLAWLITHRINRALREASGSVSQGSDSVRAASGEITTASVSLAEGSSELAASIQQMSASLEEISSMTRRNAGHAQDALQLAQETRSAAENSKEGMEALVTAMDAIQGAGENVSKIVKTIDEIAFQTNLLALNAAVEAARAGEAGAGFAVVADEVRSLAQRSAVAAKETTASIQDSIEKSQRGVSISGEVSERFKEIVNRTTRVASLVAEIAGASDEQSKGVAQVLTAVTHMDTATQTTAASAEECASAATELEAQAVSLSEVVSRLGKLAGTQAHAPRTGENGKEVEQA